VDTANEYVLYPTFGDVWFDPEWPSTTIQVDRPNFRRGLGHKNLDTLQSFWRDPPADLEKELGSPDVVHANNFFCPTTLKRARLVYTLYDLGFFEYPDATTEQNRTGCFSGVFNAGLHADLIVSISHYSREHFLRTFPHYPADRVVVVHPASRYTGCTEIPQPKELGQLVPGQFWLSVGTLEPRKNHRRLAAAYAELKKRVPETYPLVLAGAQGWLMEGFEKYLDELGIRQHVICPGYVDDAALQWLYQNCYALVYPSIFEGFGLPVLEAMSLGTAAITSDVTSIPEITEDTQMLIDPHDEGSILRAMQSVWEDRGLHARLKDSAVRQAGKFSWASAAALVAGHYQRVAQEPPLADILRTAAGAAA
jgi:glycosyltransferase involved in cell wall biosynthesis